MKRKLIKQGLGGCTIYLPKKWIDKKGIKSGDEIDLIETDEGLLINTEIKGKKEITIKLNETNKKDIQNILTHTYRKGIDTIKITNLDKETFNIIKKVVNKTLLGFEITENNESSLKIENISEPTDQKYNAIVRKTFLIIKESLDILTDDCVINKFSNLDEIKELRTHQDSLILFCRRTLMKNKYEHNTLLEWELLTFLMHIEHAIFYLYEYASNNKSETDKETLKLMFALKDYFADYYTAYFSKDTLLIHSINEQKKGFHFGKCIGLLEKSKSGNTVILAYLKEIFRLIQIGTSPILAMCLES